MLRGDRWRCRDGHFTVVFVLASVCSDRNWRLRHGGTGLGLAITRRDKVTSSHSHWSPLGSMSRARTSAVWPKLVTQRKNSPYLLADQTVDARSPSLLEVAVVKGNGAVGRKPDRLVEVGDGALVLAF